MPNIAALLKAEISRVARKEVRSEIASLKKSAKLYRAEIATLKRRTLVLENHLRRLGKASAKAAPVPAEPDPSAKPRFSAKGLASQRRRLGLSAQDLGMLVGASSQSIYNWEQGKARPLERHLAAIASIRALGRREAAARLASLHG
jgi:DNA-binding transcriptional regulator YiaG